MATEKTLFAMPETAIGETSQLFLFRRERVGGVCGPVQPAWIFQTINYVGAGIRVAGVHVLTQYETAAHGDARMPGGHMKSGQFP